MSIPARDWWKKPFIRIVRIVKCIPGRGRQHSLKDPIINCSNFNPRLLSTKLVFSSVIFGNKNFVPYKLKSLAILGQKCCYCCTQKCNYDEKHIITEVELLNVKKLTYRSLNKYSNFPNLGVLKRIFFVLFGSCSSPTSPPECSEIRLCTTYIHL